MTPPPAPRGPAVVTALPSSSWLAPLFRCRGASSTVTHLDTAKGDGDLRAGTRYCAAQELPRLVGAGSRWCSDSTSPRGSHGRAPPPPLPALPTPPPPGAPSQVTTEPLQLPTSASRRRAGVVALWRPAGAGSPGVRRSRAAGGTVSCHAGDLDPATGPLVDVDGSVDTVDPFGGALPEVDEQLDLARLGDCRARRSSSGCSSTSLLRQRWTDCLQRKGRARCFHFRQALCAGYGGGTGSGSARAPVGKRSSARGFRRRSRSLAEFRDVALAPSPTIPPTTAPRTSTLRGRVLRTEGGAAAGGGPRAATSSLVTVAASCGSTAAGSWRLRRSSESSAHARRHGWFADSPLSEILAVLRL